MRFTIKTQDGVFISKSCRESLVNNITALAYKYAIVIVQRPELENTHKMAYELRKGYYDANKAKKYFP